MIQKCFVGDKVGNFIRIEGIMDKNVLLQNIAHYVFYVGRGLLIKDVFQHHNDPKHSLKLCRNYTESKQK